MMRRPPSVRAYAVWIVLGIALTSALAHLGMLAAGADSDIAESIDVAVAALTGIGAALWLSGYVSRPLRSIEGVARKAAGGPIDERAVPEGPRECVALAQTVNNLLEVIARTAEENEALALYMQRLSRHALALRDLERRSVATELHDRVGQNLAAAQMTIRAVRATVEQLGPSGEEAARHLTAVEALLQAANERTRNLLTRLRPPLLDEFGIASALQAHARQMADRGASLRVDVVSEGPEARLEATTEGVVFEVLAEAIHNAEKHAGTASALVTVRTLEDRVEFLVHDEGRGFDASAVAPGTWGLYSMRERIRNLGGQFEVDSGPDVGTSVRVVIPRLLRTEPRGSPAATSPP